MQAYSEIVVYLANAQDECTWFESFLLAYLDCAVQWDADGFKNKVFLFGPWHPLVVATRFMVQAALYGSASRSISKAVDYKFHRLAVLLDQVTPFRWLPCVESEDNSLGHIYISPTSDPGWLIGVHLATTGRLEDVVSRLRGSLGLEAGVLPLSKEQMALGYMRDFCNAFPIRRSLAMRVASGFSPGRIVESAASLLYNDDGPTEYGAQLPGGVHVSFSEEPEGLDTLQWRSPPICIYASQDGLESATKSNLDLNLLSPPSQLRFLPSSEHVPMPRGVGDAAVFFVPGRRITVGAEGTPVATIYEAETEKREGSSLGDTFVKILCTIRDVLPGERRTSWTFDLPRILECPWTIVPGSQLDPSVLVQYIRDGYEKVGQPRALWDYNFSITGAFNSYFILSKIPEGITASLNGSSIFQGRDVAAEIIKELGEIGIAIGSETMRSGEKALGAIGLVGAIRLFSPGGQGTISPLRNDESSAGFLLPVDSFKEFLGDFLEEVGSEQRKRADLVAIQCKAPHEGQKAMLSFCAIECKYSSGEYRDVNVNPALEQAIQTYDRLHALANAAISPDGIPERLALMNLVSFGLRLTSQNDEQSLVKEQAILGAILQGEFELIEPADKAVLVTSECGHSTAELRKRHGWWARLAPGHWPGISESEALCQVRENLAALFSAVVEGKAPSGAAHPMPTQGSGGPSVGATVEGRLIRILVGADKVGSRIFYDPQSRERPLDNYNIMVTGSSGKGKTQLIKALACGLRDQGKNLLMLDFKNDFASDAPFLKRAGLSCQYVAFDGLPYNPLIPFPALHPGTGERVVHCAQHITGVSAVLSKTFGLGMQQEAALKDAIRGCFRDYGVDPSGIMLFDEKQDFPDFNDVGSKLQAAHPLAYNRLDPLFDLGVFHGRYKKASFDTLLGGSLVVDLSGIQSDHIKNALAQMIVLSAHAYLNSLPHSSVLRQFFIFDEAHRVLASEFLVKFIRECRAYGVGVALSSQYPSDFSTEVSSSLNTKIIHGNDRDKEKIRDIENLLGYKGNEQRIAELGMFEAVVSNPQHRNIFVGTLAYPHYLVYSALTTSGEANLDDFQGLEGLDTNRLSLENIIGHLKRMGLVEEIGRMIKPL